LLNMSRRPTVAATPEEAQSRLRAVLAAGLCEPCGQPYKTWGRALASSRVKNKGQKSLDKYTECGVCMNKLFENAEYGDETKDVEVLIESCGHAFHLTCLQGSIKAGHRNCPLCRKPIKQTVLTRLGGDENIQEGEEQRLGNRSTDPNEANWYSEEEELARANNPENDDGLSLEHMYDPFEGYEGDDLVQEIKSSFQLNDDDNVNLVHQKLIMVYNDWKNLTDVSLPPPFERWVVYAMEKFDVSPPFCGRWAPMILEFARNDPRTVDFNSIVIEAIKIMKLERGDAFVCIRDLKTYLESINNPAMAFTADLAIEAL